MKTSDQMIQELYTVILGVPDTADRGMAQQTRDIEAHLRLLNSQVSKNETQTTKNTTWRKAMLWAIGVIGTGLGIIAGIVLV